MRIAYRLARQLFIAGTAFFAVTASAIPENAWRKVTREEAIRLFQLATNRPSRAHFGAIVEQRRRPATAEDITAIAALQKSAVSRAKTMSPQLEEKNRIALQKSLAEVRIQYVEEWYSRNFIKYDSFPEAAIADTKARIPQISEVELYDREFSPYLHFRINRPIRSATLFTTPITPNRSRAFWSVACMDAEFLVLVLDALGDISPRDVRLLARQHYAGLNRVAVSDVKLRELVDGSNREWRIDSSSEASSASRTLSFKLIGDWHIGEDTYKVDAECTISRVGSRDAFISGRSYNRTLDRIYESEMGDFGADDIARTWKRTEKKGREAPEMEIAYIKSLNTKLLLRDEDIFLPPTETTLPNYNIFVASGDRRKLITKIKEYSNAPKPVIDFRRIWIIAGLVVGPVLVPLWMFAIRKRAKAKAT